MSKGPTLNSIITASRIDAEIDVATATVTYGMEDFRAAVVNAAAAAAAKAYKAGLIDGFAQGVLAAEASDA